MTGVQTCALPIYHWAAFKLDKIFFTVMSRKGQLLPLPQLQSIAHEIARQRK